MCGGGASHTLPPGPPSLLRETFLVSKGAASSGKGGMRRESGCKAVCPAHWHIVSHFILFKSGQLCICGPILQLRRSRPIWEKAEPRSRRSPLCFYPVPPISRGQCSLSLQHSSHPSCSQSFKICFTTLRHLSFPWEPTKPTLLRVPGPSAGLVQAPPPVSPDTSPFRHSCTATFATDAEVLRLHPTKIALLG